MSAARAAAGPSALRWTAFVAWAAAIWVLSSRSRPQDDLGWTWEVSDKLVHGVVFAAGGVLAAAAFASTRVRSPALWAITACAAWGCADEIHQGFVPGRSTEVLDVVADVTGATLGVALCTALAAFLGRRALRARASR